MEWRCAAAPHGHEHPDDERFDLIVDGLAAARAPLTWGQLNIWRPLEQFGAEAHVFNGRSTLTLTAPVPRAVALAAVATIVARHAALRCHFGGEQRTAMQHARERGSVAVAVRVATQETGARTADELAATLAATAFDHEREWPLRLGLVEKPAGSVVAITLVSSHVALDGWASDLVTSELESLLAGRPLQAVAWDPLQQAQLEHSEQGRARTASAVRHWRSRLSTAPPRTVHAWQPSTPPVRRWAMVSTHLAVAVGAITARTQTSTSSVLLTLAALGHCASTGADVAALRLISSNRFTEQQRNLAATTAQNGLVVTPLGSDGLDTLVRRVHQEARLGYFYAAYDPRTLDDAISEEFADRMPDAFFNDARRGDERPFTGESVRGDYAKTTMRELAPLQWHDMAY